MSSNQDKFINALDASVDAHTFSGVVSVRLRDKPLYERASGYADRSNKVANALDTRFGIASGTKFLTALAIGKLIAAQKLSLNTKIKECINFEFPNYSPEINIRHLLTHTSGIPDYFDEEKIEDFDNFSLNRPWYQLKGPRDYLDVFPDEPMKFSPGTQFSYSNGGFILLGVIIEEITGIPYQQYVEQEIFKPIGMNKSGFFAFNRLPGQTAFGYIEEESGGWRTNIYNLPIVGASDGGAYTTIGDLDLLWTSFWANEILPNDLVKLYATPHVKAKKEDEATYYGLWINSGSKEAPEFYILGGDAGVSFRSSIKRASGLQITVISNTSNGAWPVLRDIRSAIEALYLEDEGKM
jgi:CubicO group peptidase (beta-lactamase class C family)